MHCLFIAIRKQDVMEMETKKCNKCDRTLPIDKFRLVKGQTYKSYYLGQCKECEHEYQKKYKEEQGKVTFSPGLEILINIHYKEIKPERILDITNLDIIPLGVDEIFVRLMDYKNTWLSNYGRVIRYSGNQYNMLQGSYDNNGLLRYSVRKNIYFDGNWIYKSVVIYAAQAVVEEFVVNPDKQNNIFIWHSGYDKQDYYYRSLYPLNNEQYKAVKSHFIKTGDDSIEFIEKVMNETKYKADDWSKKTMIPVMCGVGYRGCKDVDCKSEAYIRWHDMMNRCYNDKFHKRQPQYQGCTVCEEWHNFSNFKVWYNENKYGNGALDLDKDILLKGNMVYSPETVCFVPHIINTLFLSGKRNRGKYPIGVYFEKAKGKYRACLSWNEKQMKLGTYDSPEDAFNKYKQCKEEIIKNIAEQYKEKIPHKVYEAMVSWEIEITD